VHAAAPGSGGGVPGLGQPAAPGLDDKGRGGVPGWAQTPARR